MPSRLFSFLLELVPTHSPTLKPVEQQWILEKADSPSLLRFNLRGQFDWYWYRLWQLVDYTTSKLTIAVRGQLPHQSGRCHLRS